MRVSINRKALLGYLKSMIRVVPMSSPIMELMGILVECNEDDGFVYITATNIETSIQRKFKADIEEGGSMVVSARMFYNITDLLGGDDVLLEYDGKLLGVTSGSCRYDIPVLIARNYPKTNIPFPDDILKIKGICSLYSKTSASVSTDKNKPSLTGIHLDIYSDTVRAASCDTNRLSVTEVKCECGGKLSVTIPKQSFSYLAHAVNDSDTLEMGLCGNSVVFMKEDMLFSTRIIAEPFLDTSRLLEAKDKKLVAKIKAADMRDMIDTVSMVTGISEETAPVAVKFKENSIQISMESTDASSKLDISADIIDTSDGEYYYNANYLADMLKVVKGDVVIHMTNNGILYVSNASSEYMLINTKKRTVKHKAKKTASKVKKAA